MTAKTFLPIFFVSFLASFAVFAGVLKAQTRYIVTPSPSPVASVEPSPVPTENPTPRPDITQKTEESVGPLEKLLNEQQLGSVYVNPLKYAIRASVEAGVPANTIVLLLLVPLIAAFVASARHIVGIRGFGIFLPAALSVVFVAIGPIVGLILFLVIIFVSTAMRFVLRKAKIKLLYLPRMAMMLLFVVFGVLLMLFTAPIIKRPEFANVSIFPVLVLVLLAEDFSKVQIGKSARVAINLTTETLILALLSYVILTLEPIQKFALLNPEILLTSVMLFDYAMGKFVGLRFAEYWRFRKIITG